MTKVFAANAHPITRGDTSATWVANAVKPTSIWAYPNVVRARPKMKNRMNARSRSTRP